MGEEGEEGDFTITDFFFFEFCRSSIEITDDADCCLLECKVAGEEEEEEEGGEEEEEEEEDEEGELSATFSILLSLFFLFLIIVSFLLLNFNGDCGGDFLRGGCRAAHRVLRIGAMSVLVFVMLGF